MLLALSLIPMAARPDENYKDPEFNRLPIAAWLAQPKSQQQIRWNVTVSPAELSTHQRLIVRATARVDGRELEKRRNSGKFEALAQYADAFGHVWQTHTTVDPATLQAAMQRQYLDIHFYAFILPGDYTLSLAVCDPGTLEHSTAIRKVHVAPLKTEPLPDLWKGLPPVEIVPSTPDPPDVWFLPEIESRLNLPVVTKRPVHIELVLNTTPSQRVSGSASAMRDNMRVLIPALKILSQMQLRNGTIHATLLDLTHRKVAFEQTNATNLDWENIRKFFLGATPGIVDVRTLEGQHRILPFFRDEIKKRLEPDTVVIVLSGPAFYEDQEAVETPNEIVDPARQLIYIRYRTVSMQRRLPPALQAAGRGGRFGSRSVQSLPENDALIPPLGEDDLEKTVEPLNPRIFDAASGTQFRRILAAVVEQISRM
jgi:hypothetical protein